MSDQRLTSATEQRRDNLPAWKMRLLDAWWSQLQQQLQEERRMRESARGIARTPVPSLV